MIFISSRRLQEADTEQRLKAIHEWFTSNLGATTNQAITFMPETKYMVELYYRNKKSIQPYTTIDNYIYYRSYINYCRYGTTKEEMNNEHLPKNNCAVYSNQHGTYIWHTLYAILSLPHTKV